LLPPAGGCLPGTDTWLAADGGGGVLTGGEAGVLTGGEAGVLTGSGVLTGAGAVQTFSKQLRVTGYLLSNDRTRKL